MVGAALRISSVTVVGAAFVLVWPAVGRGQSTPQPYGGMPVRVVAVATDDTVFGPKSEPVPPLAGSRWVYVYLQRQCPSAEETVTFDVPAKDAAYVDDGGQSYPAVWVTDDLGFGNRPAGVYVEPSPNTAHLKCSESMRRSCGWEEFRFLFNPSKKKKAARLRLGPSEFDLTDKTIVTGDHSKVLDKLKKACP